MMILIVAELACTTVLFGCLWLYERRRSDRLRRENDAMRRLSNIHDAIARKSSDIVCLLTEQGVFQWASLSVEPVLGWRITDLLGHSWKEYAHPDDLWLWNTSVNSQNETVSQEEPMVRQGRFRHRSGAWVWLETCTTSVAGEGLSKVSWLSKLRDISQRKSIEIAQARANARLAEQAALDSLTGVFNRRHILLTLEKEIGRARSNGHPLSVLLIDVDHFTPFNEHYGHSRGDLRLREVARQIGASLQRPADIAGRYSGKVFMVLLPETDTRGMRQASEKIRRNVEDMRVEHTVSPFGIITVSIGVAYLRTVSDTSTETYIELADTALHEAKRRGRNCVICNVKDSALSGENVSLPAN